MQDDELNKDIPRNNAVAAGPPDGHVPEPLQAVNIPKDVTQEQIPPTRPKVSKGPIFKKLAIILAVVVLLAIAGVAAWKLIPDKADQTQPAENTQQQSQQTQPEASTADIGDTTLSETYESGFLALELKHPASWKASEENNGLFVKSPPFKIKEKNGSESTVSFKLYIKRGAAGTDGKYLGRGYAVAQSEKITYSDPAAGQRKDSFLTNFGLDTPDNFAYFVVQGNFNLMQGDTLGPKFAQEVDSYLIAGSFATEQQTDGLSSVVLPQDSFAEHPAYKTAVEIVKSLQLK